MASKVGHFVCLQSGEQYTLQQARWCSEQGNLLDIQFNPTFPLDKIQKRPKNLWRYWEALPIDSPTSIVSFSEGATPLNTLEFEGKPLRVKLEYLNPTGSFKDRGTSVLVSKLKEWGVQQVVEDSSGNAGASIAAYCAKAGIKANVFVPAHASPSKIAQIRAYGAQIHLIEGSRDKVAQAALQLAHELHYASHVWHPLFIQGMKTFAYELCEQSRWQAPDTVVLPAGNGSLLIGCYIGFRELKQAGIIGRIPKLIGVQPQHCAPLYEAFVKGKLPKADYQAKPTLAEGMAVAHPLRGKQMIQYVELSGGKFVTVTESEIAHMTLELARRGYLVEPTCAAVVAGARHYLLHEALPDEVVVAPLTATGLKSIDTIQKLLG